MAKCNQLTSLPFKGLTYRSTHHRWFWGRSFQPITWLVQKPSLNQIKLQPSYYIKT